MITIRHLNEMDAEAYRAIRLEALRTCPDMYGQTLEEAERDTDFRAECVFHPEKFLMGAFHGGHLVGITAFRRQTRTKLRHRGDIIQVFVRAEYTRRGIARDLVSHVIHGAFEGTDIEFLELGVRPFNAPAIGLYESLGFEKIALWPDYFREGDKEGGQLYMRLSRDRK